MIGCLVLALSESNAFNFNPLVYYNGSPQLLFCHQTDTANPDFEHLIYYPKQSLYEHGIALFSLSLEVLASFSEMIAFSFVM
jgi:hypothetical protein